jgi:hypothetical protein
MGLGKLLLLLISAPIWFPIWLFIWLPLLLVLRVCEGLLPLAPIFLAGLAGLAIIGFGVTLAFPPPASPDNASPKMTSLPARPAGVRLLPPLSDADLSPATRPTLKGSLGARDNPSVMGKLR